MAEEQSGENLKNAKLSKADLTDRDLRGADLTRANLSSAQLTGMDLTGAVLVKANLQDADLNGATLRDVNATGAKVRGVWEKVVLKNVNLSDATSPKWSLVDCELDGVSLQGASVRRLSLTRCRVTNCRFVKASFPDVVFVNCQFIDCDFSGGDLSCPDIKNTEFHNCRFEGADLSGPVIERCGFPGCNLTKTDFIAGEFKDVNLADAQVEKANFRYARGLPDEFVAELRERGARVSRKLMRKAVAAVFSSKIGRIAVVALVLLVVFLVHAHRRTPDNWDNSKLFEAAKHQRESGDRHEALKYYDILLDRHPDDEMVQLTAFMQKAQTYVELEQYEDAIKIYQSLLESETVESMVKLSIRFELLQALQLKGETEEVMQQLLELAPLPQFSQNLFEILGRLVGSGSDKKYFEWLVVNLEELEKRVPKTARARLLLTRGVVLTNLNRTDEALDTMRRIIKLDGAPEPVVLRAYMQLARLQQQLGDIKTSRQTYSEMRRRFPDAKSEIIFSRLNEAVVAQGQGRFEEAEKIFLEVLQNSMEDLPRNTARLGLASAYISRRRFDEAEKLVEDVRATTGGWDNQHIDSLRLLATLRSERGDIDGAEKLLREAIEEAPNNRVVNRLRRELVHVYRRGGRYNEAIDLMKTVIDSDNVDTAQQIMDLNQYADMLSAIKDYGRAVDVYERVVTLAGDDAATGMIERYVDSMVQAGMIGYANKYLQGIIDKNPAASTFGVWAKLELVSLEQKEGRPQVANRYLRDVLKLDFSSFDTPANFMKATWAKDPESQKLAVELLRKIAAAQSADSFAGGNARLVLANKTIDTREDQPEGWADLVQTLANEVAANNKDANLVVQAYELLTRLAQHSGDTQKAIDDFAQIIKRTDDNRLRSIARFDQARLYYNKGEKKKGLTLMEEARAECADPNDCCTIAFQLGQKLVDNDRRKEAQEIFVYIRDALPNCWSRDEAMVMLDAMK